MLRQKHPFRLNGQRVKFSVRDVLWIVRKILVAEQQSVFVNSRRPKTETAFKIMFDTHADRGGVPKISGFVAECAAVTGSAGESGRNNGIWIVLLPFEFTERVI